MKASQGGKLPIVCDTSPCLSTLKGALTSPDLKCVPRPPAAYIRSCPETRLFHQYTSCHDPLLYCRLCSNCTCMF